MEKEYLKENIQDNIDFIVDFLKVFGLRSEVNSPLVKRNFSKILFVLFVLAFAKSKNFKVILDLQALTTQVLNDFEMQSLEEKVIEEQYVYLYALRIFKLLKLDYSKILEKFRVTDLSKINTYPVLGYLYVNAFNELGLENQDNIYKDIYLKSIRYFDYLLFTLNASTEPLFFISEITAWKNTPMYLQNEASSQMNRYIEKNLNSKYSSSGIAKCLEHFGRVKDVNNFHKVTKYLETRKPNMQNKFIDHFFKKYKTVYFENTESSLVSIDINAHLILAYINMYE